MTVSLLHHDERHQRRCRGGHLIGERRDIKLHALPRMGRAYRQEPTATKSRYT